MFVLYTYSLLLKHAPSMMLYGYARKTTIYFRFIPLSFFYVNKYRVITERLKNNKKTAHKHEWRKKATMMYTFFNSNMRDRYCLHVFRTKKSY